MSEVALRPPAETEGEDLTTKVAADKAAAPQKTGLAPTDYSWTEPEARYEPTEHFSNILLLSGDLLSTGLELLILGSAIVAGITGRYDVAGSSPLLHVGVLLFLKNVFARLYNTYLEACYFSFPTLRTQPPKDQLLFKNKKDLMGRDLKQLEKFVVHDRLTLITSLSFELFLYFAVPGFFPAPQAPVGPWYTRILRFFGNHYLMSFGMYWSHRALHVVPFLWDRIHSYHHFARHPLSRNTYQDHFLDNFGNQIIGQTVAQIVCPLDYWVFWFSRYIRVAESLEKHSGVSCRLNLAHSMQTWLPCVQMPHHHDWHHEGHKGCNYSFSPMGGLWDCANALVTKQTTIISSPKFKRKRSQVAYGGCTSHRPHISGIDDKHKVITTKGQYARTHLEIISAPAKGNTVVTMENMYKVMRWEKPL